MNKHKQKQSPMVGSSFGGGYLHTTRSHGDAAATQKYIPPPLRHAPPCNYKVPRLRQKKKEVAKANTGSESKVATSIIQQIPLNDTIFHDDGGTSETKIKPHTREGDDGAELESSYNPLSATSSLLSGQQGISDETSPSNVRRGGCADPTVILGSITDDIFIPPEASILDKKAQLQPYGGIGGGFFTSMRCAQVEDGNDTGSRTFLSGLKWEVGASSECGVKDSNEDSYVVINNLDEMISSHGLKAFAEQNVGQTKQQGLFAIFDGHAGNQGEACPLHCM